MLSAVLNGQAELGIALEGDRHPELVETPLMTDPLVFIFRRPNPLQQRDAVTWADLRDIELIGVSSVVAIREFMDYRLAERGIRLQAKYEVQHNATALNLVAAGVGYAVLPSSTFREGDRPGLRKIPLGGPAVKRKVVLLRPRRRTLSPAAEAFHFLRDSSIDD